MLVCRIIALHTSPRQIELAKKLHYQDSTGLSHFFYNPPPKVDHQFTFAKRIQDMLQGITILQLLIACGAGTDLIPDILKWLTFTEFAELEAAAELLGFSLLRFVANDAKLSRRIVYENHFSIMKSKPVADNPVINFEYVWSLSPSNLLLEARRLSFTEPIYIIDHGIIALKQSGVKPKVAFNPVYELIAVAVGRSLHVATYGGSVKEDRGQILYYKPEDNQTDPFYNTIRHIDCLSWSPTGELLVLIVNPVQKIDLYERELIIFKYNPTTFTLKICLHADMPLRGDSSMLSPSMWTNGNSFLWTPGSKDPLTLITITAQNEVVARKICDNVHSLFDIHKIVGQVDINLDDYIRGTPLGQRLSWQDPEDYTSRGLARYGNIFSTYGPKLNYFYCIVQCPMHQDKHDCVAVFSRTVPPKFEYLILIPGHVVEVKTLGSSVFILYARLAALHKEGPNEFTKVLDPKVFFKCGFIFKKNTVWENYSVHLLTFSDFELEPRELSKSGRSLTTANLVQFRNKSIRQRGLFEDRLESACLMPTDNFVGLCLDGCRANTINTPDLDCVCLRVFIQHQLTDLVKRTNYDSPTYVFHHPSKAIVYTFPFFNGWTPFVSITADATYTDFMAYSEHTSADPHQCSLYMPLAKSPPQTDDNENSF